MVANTKRKNILILSLAALGVVYGDIGTSPLYAINEIFFGHGHVALKQLDILGAISLVVWTLTLLIAVKYILLVLRANHEGRGGVFALYNLLQQLSFKGKAIFTAMLIVAAGLLFGDGIITPAISVISSTEGLAAANLAFKPLIVPLSIIILTALFIIQKKGTAKIGTFFAPAIIVWFVSIATIGILQILKNPGILFALNPYYGLVFLLSHSFLSVLLTLGSVMLVITGGEAMYADISHFGVLPIRITWFTVVYPSLILNYLGQGAYLLSGEQIHNGNIFYSTIPHFFLYPMIFIATVATIIASQALISGAFSLASQAISLKLFPFLRVIHTYANQEGQIYVPFINWALFIGCVVLVLVFKSSTNLASAYGLAVSGVMLITSWSMIQITSLQWKWNRIFVYGIFVPFILIDTLFLIANSLKFVEGGYIPIGIGLLLYFIMTTWKWGKTQTIDAIIDYPAMTVQQLVDLAKSSPAFFPKTAIILCHTPIVTYTQEIPTLNQLLKERYDLLPSSIIFLSIKQLPIPYCDRQRFEITNLYKGEKVGNITTLVLNFGFRENPNAKIALQKLAREKQIDIFPDPDDWYIHIIEVRPTGEKIRNLWGKIKFQVFKFIRKNTDSAETYFGLGSLKNISAEIFHVSLR
ncbi:MAG TPA: KUP/HAK/KT family potassium transporter [Patescibacteria group bacterium]